MKHICIVTPGLKRGGMERVISELSNYMVNKEYKITVISLLRSEVGYHFDEKVEIIFPTYTYKSNLFNKIKVLSYLFSHIKKVNPDVVLGFSEIFNPLTIIASKLNFKKVFVSDRSNPLRKQNFINRNFRKFTYPFADGIIAQTERAKQIFIKRKYNKNIKVIANPLKEINNNNFNADLKGIVHVGSLIKRKNQTELIRIFHQLNKEDWKLYLVGEGPERSTIESLIQELNLGSQVFLVGEVDDVDTWLGKGSIFSFVSLAEGFPNALSEAMAFPLASIAYDCPTGIKELINDGENGFIVPLQDFEVYKTKLGRLIENEDLRLKIMKNSILIREKYTIQNIGDDFLTFIT